MIILSAGMKKSGSTWIFHMINELLKAAGYDDTYQTLRFLPRPGMLRKPYNLQLLLASIPSLFGKTYVIKSHTPPIFLAKLLISMGAMKAIYSYRDPRDAALSMRDFGQMLRNDKNRLLRPKAARIESVEEALIAMRAQVNIWSAWNEYGSGFMVRYEDLRANPIKHLRSIADYLALKISDDEISDIIEQYDMKNMSEKKQKTMKYNKGKTNRYLTEMTPDQLALSSQIFSPHLSEMGYPTSVNDI